jgi:N-acetylglucosaminyldiphosphoundecaprenol N-acetyl-beta-D-mannosaminyltransferase
MSSASLERRRDYAVAAPYRSAVRADSRVTLLGAAMDLVKPEEVLGLVGRRIAEGRRVIVANHNLHSLYLAPREPQMAALYARADLIEVDSTPLTIWARLIYGRGRRFHRSTYMDFRSLFWDLAEANGWRVYYLGGRPGVIEAARDALLKRWPGAIIGGRDGYFARGGEAEQAVLADIAAFAPHVLLVGMGMPVQEVWIERWIERLPACAILPVGAAFDYEAGIVPTPPSWTGRMGLEWLWRLAAEPKRMAVRYLVEPWSLVGPALADLVGRDTLRSRHAPVAPPVPDIHPATWEDGDPEPIRGDGR